LKVSASRENNKGKDKDVVIRVRGLVNAFGDQILHDHLDLDVYRGEVLGVVGGSGTGKSVLLRSIIGLNKIQSGTIEVFGKDTANLNEHQMREIEMRWGVLFQEGALFSSQTIAENIQVPLREYLQMPQDLMNEIASMVGLEEEHFETPMRNARDFAHRSASWTGTRFRSHFGNADVLVDQKSLNLTVFMVTRPRSGSALWTIAPRPASLDSAVLSGPRGRFAATENNGLA
jgi:ABC-type sugar transport system ATPase subunit